ncbi:MAG: dienelactone hydrolase family protein [Cyclobacteriaceae bacterium]|nr:dienelactone hydrolase family protein [Cyclobacteriaceae bacterium]
MKQLKIKISETIGTVSAALLEPPNMKALIVLAHGAGAGMNHIFMTDLSEALAARNIGTLRYNFPYMENGKKRPDVPAVATKTAEMVLAKAHELFPKAKIFGAGKSFGGRMTSQYLSKNHPAYVNGLLFYGFPLHAAGDPGVDRADHLKTVAVPMLFLQGSRDALAELKLIKQVTKKLKTATLEIFEGADHSFKSGKKIFIPELADATQTWIESLP